MVEGNSQFLALFLLMGLILPSLVTQVAWLVVWLMKSDAMSAMAAQQYLQDHYTRRAEQRAFQARYTGFGPETKYVEAFQRLTPEKKNAL